MSGGSHIRAVGSESGADAHVETAVEGSEPLTLEESWVEDSNNYEERWDGDEATPRGERLIPTLAFVAAAGWTGFFVWAHLAAFAGGAAPTEWSALVAEWAVPVLLVVSLFLLAMRLSKREASRFADAAISLRTESEMLEARLTVVNRELSLAREFLAAQTRELESLGRVATQRLSENAGTLQGLIHDNGAQVDRIAGVSRSALENMDKLRDDLPVIANAARDVSNQIGAAGNTAHGQLDELVAGFTRLNEFGQASERQVGSLRAKVDAALAAFAAQTKQLDEIAGARFAALREKSEEFRVELDGREIDVLAALRHRADKLREEVGSAAAELELQEGELLKSLQARVTTIRESADAIGSSLVGGEREALAAWTRRVEGMQADIAAAIRHVDAIDTAAKAGAEDRLRVISEEAAQVDEKLTQSHALFVGEIDRRREEASAIATRQAEEISARLAELDASFEASRARLAEELEARRAQAADLSETQANAIAATLAELDTAIVERRAGHAVRTQEMAEYGEAMVARFDELGERMATAADRARETEGALATAIEALAAKLRDSRESLSGTDRAVSVLTDASVRLLELIQASADHSQTVLPAALADTEQRLARLGEDGHSLKMMIGEIGSRSEDVSNYVLAAQRESEATMTAIRAFHDVTLSSHEEGLARVQDLRGNLAASREESEALAQTAQGALRDAIAQLDASARQAIAAIETDSVGRIAALADTIADKATGAVDRVLQTRVGIALAELETSAAHAAGAGREAATQLRDQLARVNELAGNLESRVDTARRRAEEQVDNDFSRRVALITESLNSHAIDIARALDTDVSDSAWTSYLRGDRGIFTRRAVRLLEPSQTRAVAELYESDSDFREHVNRYIHDFEAMLRTMLSTRDGHAIGVTLLSSDMGKLYVALAQAIERLRD